MPIVRLLRRFALLGLIAAYLYPAAAHAHAILMESLPPAGASVQAGATTLRLRFNIRVDHVRSRLTLVGPGGGETVLKLDRGTNDEVLASHADLIPGNAVVRWQVLALDGHITRGEIAFTVTPAPAAPVPVPVPTPAPAAKEP